MLARLTCKAWTLSLKTTTLHRESKKKGLGELLSACKILTVMKGTSTSVHQLCRRMETNQKVCSPVIITNDSSQGDEVVEPVEPCPLLSNGPEPAGGIQASQALVMVAIGAVELNPLHASQVQTHLRFCFRMNSLTSTVTLSPACSCSLTTLKRWVTLPTMRGSSRSWRWL